MRTTRREENSISPGPVTLAVDSSNKTTAFVSAGYDMAGFDCAVCIQSGALDDQARIGQTRKQTRSESRTLIRRIRHPLKQDLLIVAFLDLVVEALNRLVVLRRYREGSD